MYVSEFGAPDSRPRPVQGPRERRLGRRAIGKTALARIGYRLWNEELPLLAAGVALFGLLSLMPALASIIAIYGLISSPADIAAQIAPLASVVPPEVLTVIRTQLEAAAAAGGQELGAAFLLNLGLTLFGAIGGVRSLMTAINIAHNRADTRPFLRRLGLAIVLGVGTIIGATVVVALLVVMPSVIHVLRIPADDALVASALRWPVLFCLIVGGLMVMYRFAPVDRRHRSWPGCVAATLLWMASSYGLSIYVDDVANYDGLYGAFGGVMIVVLWFYVSTFVIILGAVVNEEWEEARWRPGAPPPELPAVVDGA